MKIRYAILLMLFFAFGASAQSVQLIKDDEAKLPVQSVKSMTRAITRGPGIKLLSPETVTAPFPFKVMFEPRGQAKIDKASIKVEYLRGAGIDLTDRLKADTKETGIETHAALAPAGEHMIRVSATDSEGRQGTAEFKLTVK